MVSEPDIEQYASEAAEKGVTLCGVPARTLGLEGGGL